MFLFPSWSRQTAPARGGGARSLSHFGLKRLQTPFGRPGPSEWTGTPRSTRVTHTAPYGSPPIISHMRARVGVTGKCRMVVYGYLTHKYFLAHVPAPRPIASGQCPPTPVTVCHVSPWISARSLCRGAGP